MIKKHKGLLVKVARMYMDNSQDQQDLQQEIIIQLWKSFNTFKGTSEFSTWMYRVAINTAISYFKKEKKQANTFSHQEPPDLPLSEYDTSADRRMAFFYQAVHQLKPVEKAVIFYMLEGLAHKEIGRNLGISEGNARVKLNRAKEKLQNILKDKAYEI
nr:sigma-70 family RNA polymerase sigma factor [Pedobacter sp. SYSU D00823]